VLGRRCSARWCLTNDMAVDSPTAGHRKHGRFDAWLKMDGDSEPVPTSVVDGE
jgi:hypothetical protein